VNLLLWRRDIVSGSNAKIFTFIASTNANLRALHILPRGRGEGENNVEALSRSCALGWILFYPLYASKRAKFSGDVRHNIRLIKSLPCLILSEGQISVPNGNARNLFALFWRPGSPPLFAREVTKCISSSTHHS